MKRIVYSLLVTLAVGTLSIPGVQAAASHLLLTHRTQQRVNWCWAAATEMVLRFYGRQFAEQCEIAELARSRWPARFGSTACCLNPDLGCNTPNVLHVSDPGTVPDILHYYNVPTSEILSPLSYTQSKLEINAGHPFIVSWNWSATSGHMVVVSGYADASGSLPNRLWVYNPAPGMGSQLLAYSAVTTPPGGTWTVTTTTGTLNTPNDSVVLYADWNFGGQNLTLQTSSNALYMNDLTTSAKVRGVPFILYEHPDQTGAAWSLSPNDWPSELLWGGTNDSVSSVRRVPGTDQTTAIILFEHPNFSGDYRIVTADNSNLASGGWGWDDRVSSVIVINKIWNLYRDPNYAGYSCAVTSFGGPNRDGFYPNPASWGGWDNDVSSVYWVPQEWDPIILYSDVSLTGRALVLWPSIAGGVLNNLWAQGFNDVTTSAKTYTSHWTLWEHNNQTGSAQTLNPNSWYPWAGDWGGANDSVTSLSYSATGTWY